MEFILPLTIIVFATIYVTIRLVLLAIKFLREKKINLGQFRLYEGEFPDELLSARYLFKNMFEIPILFYLLCLINMNLNNYFILDIILAWGFVFFKILHVFTRLKNQKKINILPRTYTFFISLGFLILGWMSFSINLILKHFF